MKNQPHQKNAANEQGRPTSDRMHHSVRSDKKQQGISNGGGQRANQTSNRDNQRKREN